MKSSCNVKFQFDWKSAYLVPLLAFMISTSSIIAVMELAENPKVEKMSKNSSNQKNNFNILALAGKL